MMFLPVNPEKVKKHTPKFREYGDRYVAFIDILGFENLIKRTEIDVELQQNVQSVLTRVFLSQDPGEPPLLEGQENDEGWGYLKPRMYSFSDCIAMSANVDKDSLQTLIYKIYELVSGLLAFGVFTRGAIVKGKLYDDRQVIYGPALIDAYKKEQNEAIYPRVIFSEEVICELSAEVNKVPSHLRNRYGNAIRRADDSFYHIGVLNMGPVPETPEEKIRHNQEKWEQWLKNIHCAILEQLALNKDKPKILKKYEWFSGYYNEFVSATPQFPAETIPGFPPHHSEWTFI
ncbi:MAG: hypothetical protein AB7P76_11125 [Candidatus Melainabacteria bacterium]